MEPRNFQLSVECGYGWDVDNSKNREQGEHRELNSDTGRHEGFLNGQKLKLA